MLQMFMIQSPN